VAWPQLHATAWSGPVAKARRLGWTNFVSGYTLPCRALIRARGPGRLVKHVHNVCRPSLWRAPRLPTVSVKEKGNDASIELASLAGPALHF
jgi:hypothetical protein